ncbi:MAG: hypothetical protein V1797_07485 [Pseudomonadota bacterium]
MASLPVWIFGSLITIGLFVIGILQTRNAQQQDRRLAAIEARLDSLGQFKDEVLKGYLTKTEHKDLREECIGKFSEIFKRLHDLEVK